MLNWSGFAELPGGQEHNFETLCRSLIRINYGRLAALANQPGVEFHLQIDIDCSLGAVGHWYGWQCRWYEIPGGRALGTARRQKIVDALRKTEVALPQLTHWILWTRHVLTQRDQDWFYNVKTKLKLNLWHSTEIESLLIGEAELLRHAYFGELILTPHELAYQHELSVEPIKKRWLPEAHQTIDAERVVRQMLGEVTSWDTLIAVADRLVQAVVVISGESRTFDGRLSGPTANFNDAAHKVADTLRHVHALLSQGDYELLIQQLEIGHRFKVLPTRYGRFPHNSAARDSPAV
jgi:hypothetical protein